MSAKFHTIKNETWTNAAGDVVPVKFVPKSDKLKEGYGAKIYKAALNAESVLAVLYGLMSEAFIEIDKQVKLEFEMAKKRTKDAGKGSVTWYTFDKSLKVEADMHEILKWDNALMTEAKELFDAYLRKNVSANNVFVNDLLTKGFTNAKGMIDSKKVFTILKYEKKVNDKGYTKACDLMKQAQDVDKTKLYMRVWEKMEDGSYRNINLNFSSL